VSCIPRLVVTLPLEGRARIALHTSSAEDEQRLRVWLREPEQVYALSELLGRLLDDLDRLDDRGEAA
jgi:hypothetical protein